jgi:acetyltransferase-like isoleucine patch superfamily enzyme
MADRTNTFILNVKRGKTPFHRFLRGLLKGIFRPTPPRIPRLLRSPLRLLYELHFLMIAIGRGLILVFYRHPLFQARCASVGKNLTIGNLPFVSGHLEIHIGNNVLLGGNLSVLSGSATDRPRLILGDRAELGWNVAISVSKEVVIEEDARVSYDCRISDNDGHPREADLRAANQKVRPRDIRPVRICRNAWVGNGTHIMKGVTIGEGAIIGANSVVISNIPPYSLAMGNPAEVFFRNFGRPSSKNPAAAAEDV